jgi:hypothetical protein
MARCAQRLLDQLLAGDLARRDDRLSDAGAHPGAASGAVERCD